MKKYCSTALSSSGFNLLQVIANMLLKRGTIVQIKLYYFSLAIPISNGV